MTPERWERIKQVFEDALERPPEERAAFVDSASGDAQASSFMEKPAVGTLTAFPSGGGQPSFSDGETISGRFKVIRFIGQGGMGEVYEAMDLELGERLA